MPVPKKIHYIWLGGKELPGESQKYINEWKELLHDYQIIKWDESNLDLNAHPFVKKAYANRQFSFVSDYFRLWILNKEGGIYLDTDVRVKKRFDEFLNKSFFIGYMNKSMIATSVIGSTAGHPYIKMLLDQFDSNNVSVGTPNNIWTTKAFIDNVTGFYLTGETMELPIDAKIYDSKYFDRATKITTKGYSTHYYYGAWYRKKPIVVSKRTEVLVAVVTEKLSNIASRFKGQRRNDIRRFRNKL